MGKLLLLITLVFTALKAILHPWAGIVAYYLLSFLGPQYIWYWNFEGLRVTLITSIFTMIGVFISIIRGKYNYKFLMNGHNLVIMFLWLFIFISYYCGPYVSADSSSGLSSQRIFYITNIIFLLFFFAVLEMNTISKLRYLTIVLSISTIYLIYWANLQYFSQNWKQFYLGRLMGPSNINGSGMYKDENIFAVLFVVGLPFIFYWGKELNKWFQYGLWAIIPMGWHAVFLTGSRGGLLGILTVIFCELVLSRKKVFVLPIILFFVLFYHWQAGNVLSERTTTIVNFEGESSAENRLYAWAGGLRMALAFPLTGVGLGGFANAGPEFYGRSMVAHNTFVQYAAESGIGAGIAYILIIVFFFKHSWKLHYYCLLYKNDQVFQKINLYNKASTTSFSGLVVCSIFLSLNIYDLFFILVLYNNALYNIALRHKLAIS
ncbi:MAG: O-antigen ligase family protein [Desulfobacter sp.]|nr:MAG: O-antigen ligase family protein [Desulfobacter sp.]